MSLRPPLAAFVLGLPVAAGLGFALQGGAGSFGALLVWPGLPRAMALSLIPGLAATLISVLAVALLLATRPPGLALLERLIAPLLALPHAAAALGLAFLIAPSGWIVRLLSPWATGWTEPPDLHILNDPNGLALTLGLVLKEAPFLLFVALGQGRAEAKRFNVARTLGYGRVMGFLSVVWPLLYPRLRLPVRAVLAYGMTTVDMGLILGPGLPHPLAVEITLWMTEPSLQHQAMASAGALLQLGLVILALLIWRGAEALGGWALQALTLGGFRLRALDRLLAPFAFLTAGLLALLPLMGLAGLALWSVAGLWSFPNAWPESLNLAIWSRAGADLLAASMTTLSLAALSVALAVVLALQALQAGQRLEGLIYIPLIVPQVAFLPGLASGLLRLPLPPFVAVMLAHLTFVLPYVFLALAGPYRSWDARMGAVAATLGASPLRQFFRLRLPMLAGALAAAAAIGLAVSVGQYLPTLLLGGGRVTTLTTEAVALASGANRRIVGAYGLMQALWPALAFALARRVRAT